MLHFLDPPEEFHPLTREDPSAFSPPPAFGPFRVLHQVGVGALGPVFRTYEPTRDRLVAVKAFRLDIVPEQAHTLAEALSRATEAGLFHPSIVEPIAAGVEGTVAYRAEEYVAAESLDVAMRHYAPAPIDTALPFITQLAGAIDFARAAGIGHGGLHPRDIFVTPDEARATGFGVVEALESVGLRAPIRRPYSAPERIAGQPWSTPADVFALAAIAYELLTARRPAGTGTQIGPPPDVEHADGVHAVLARAMADDAARRFSTALAFAGALESAARGEAPTDAVSTVEATTASRAAARTVPSVATGPGATALTDHTGQRTADHTDHTGHGATDHADRASLETQPAGKEPVFVAPPLKPEEAPEPSLLFEPEREPLEPFSEPPEPEPMERMEPVEPEEREFAAEPTYAARDLEFGAEPERSRPAVFPMAVMLVLGLLVGFGAGYFVRDRSLSRQDTAAATTAAVPPAEAVRDSTDQPVTRKPAARSADESSALLGPPSVLPSSKPATAPTPGAPVRPRATPAPPVTRPAPRAEVPAAPPAKRGRLEVRSTPDHAGVTVNGTWRGRTPLTLENLVFGRYVIRLVHPGYQVAREEFTLNANSAAKTIEAKLEREPRAAPDRGEAPEAAGQANFTGTIFVDSRPQGANVLLDGKLVGKTPLRVPDVRVGTHVVRIELAAHKPWSSTTRVTSGQEARVTGSLERFQ